QGRGQRRELVHVTIGRDPQPDALRCSHLSPLGRWRLMVLCLKIAAAAVRRQSETTHATAQAA
ncbi:MAG: hypothetical protein KC549_06070, partial [Myxococcales bacterium]|nr:hypothetical protein [Myxococcales bacterium]